jgi:glutathione S-transferase
MLKLYGSAWSRAAIVQWYLEELALPYEFVTLDLKVGEHQQSDYLAINPVGKIPAIVDGNFKLWESGAILLYLAEKYGQTESTIEQRAHLAQWSLFANSTLGTEIFSPTRKEAEVARLMQPLNAIFEQQPFLMGDQLTAADIAIGSTLAYGLTMLKPDWNAYPAVLDYIQRLSDRPAFQKTIGAAR